VQHLNAVFSSSIEQRDIESEQLAQSAPQPIDPALLYQIGGGAATGLPGHGW